VTRANVVVPAIAVVLIVLGLTVGITTMARTRDVAHAATVKVTVPFVTLTGSAAPVSGRAGRTALVQAAQAAYDAYQPRDARDLRVAEALGAALRHYHSALTWAELSVLYHADHDADIRAEWREARRDVRAALAVLDW
jgi:hypothetical protein